MNLLLLFIGFGIILLGLCIWRFQWIHLLSNVDVNQVESGEESNLARFAGFYIVMVGVILMLLGYLVQYAVTEQQMLTAVLLTVVGIFVMTGIYLSGHSRYLKK